MSDPELNLGAPPEPMDPAEFTKPEWDVIKEALVRQAKNLRWRSENPELGDGEAAMLRKAAERRFEMARRCLGAKAWRKREEEEAEAALLADRRRDQASGSGVVTVTRPEERGRL